MFRAFSLGRGAWFGIVQRRTGGCTATRAWLARSGVTCDSQTGAACRDVSAPLSPRARWFPRPATRARADLGSSPAPGQTEARPRCPVLAHREVRAVAASTRWRCFPPAYRAADDVAPHGGAGRYYADQRGYPDQ